MKGHNPNWPCRNKPKSLQLSKLKISPWPIVCARLAVHTSRSYPDWNRKCSVTFLPHPRGPPRVSFPSVCFSKADRKLGDLGWPLHCFQADITAIQRRTSVHQDVPWDHDPQTGQRSFTNLDPFFVLLPFLKEDKQQQIYESSDISERLESLD